MMRAAVKERKPVDMTRGNIAKALLGFALPLVVSQIFLRLYSTVDTWVVGNFVSDEAFAAVGSTGSVSGILTNLCTGFTGGAGIVVAQYFGAKNKERIQDAVHTAISLSLILGAILTVAGYFLTPLLLKLTKTPADVFTQAQTYLQIYFLGMIPVLYYGVTHSILRTSGNYHVPILGMTFSGIANTILDLLFVIVFHWGVAGVAWATTISHFIPAIWSTFALHNSETDVRFRFHELKLSPDLLTVITHLAIPTAVQTSITSFSNTFAQRYINVLGKGVMGAWTIRNRLDLFICLGSTIFSLAISQFVGQNLGAGLVKRAKKGIWVALGLTEAVTVFMIAVVVIFRVPISQFFNQNPDIVAKSAVILLINTPFYVCYCADVIFNAALRGAGNTRTPMIIMISSYVLFRQLVLYVVSRVFPGNFIPIVLAFPAGWVMACTLMCIYFSRTKIEKTRVVKEEENRNDAEDKG